MTYCLTHTYYILMYYNIIIPNSLYCTEIYPDQVSMLTENNLLCKRRDFSHYEVITIIRMKKK